MESVCDVFRGKTGETDSGKRDYRNRVLFGRASGYPHMGVIKASVCNLKELEAQGHQRDEYLVRPDND